MSKDSDLFKKSSVCELGITVFLLLFSINPRSTFFCCFCHLPSHHCPCERPLNKKTVINSKPSCVLYNPWATDPDHPVDIFHINVLKLHGYRLMLDHHQSKPEQYGLDSAKNISNYYLKNIKS